VAASVDAVLDALGDRTRRTILEKLSSGPVAVGVLADQLPVSRPAVSQHLRVLKAAELVVETVAGTRRLYRINQSGLRIVRDYFDRFWESTLDNFAILAEAEAEAETACTAKKVRRPMDTESAAVVEVVRSVSVPLRAHSSCSPRE